MKMQRVGRLYAVGLLVLALAASYGNLNLQKGKKEKEISYSKDVFPIIKKYCLICHSLENDHPSELFLDTYEDMMNESRHGKAILPGEAEKSPFYQKLLSPPPFGRQMPPSRKIKLTPEQIELLRVWINQGAKNN